MAEPQLIFRHVDDVPWQEVKAQRQGDRRAGVHLKFMEWSPSRTLIVTHYDPGLVLDRHGHSSDHMLYITGGSLRIGDVECTPGTVVVLEHGAMFGPIVVGPQGADLLEFYTGDPRPFPAEEDGYRRLLESMGIVPEPDPPFDPHAAARPPAGAGGQAPVAG